VRNCDHIRRDALGLRCDVVKHEGGGWRIDKHIPIALLGAIGMQTATAIWWAASISANVAATQQRVDKLESASTLVINQGQQVAAMDAKVSAMQDSIKELKALVMSLVSSSRTATK
jgi:hypothetical protein